MKNSIYEYCPYDDPYNIDMNEYEAIPIIEYKGKFTNPKRFTILMYPPDILPLSV